MTRVIIAGGRDFADAKRVNLVMCRLYSSQPIVVLCGCADGADSLGYEWARENGVVVEPYPADWAKHGKAAGPIRNRLMSQKADALVAFWDGQSAGTKHMIQCALLDGLEVHVFRYAASKS